MHEDKCWKGIENRWMNRAMDEKCLPIQGGFAHHKMNKTNLSSACYEVPEIQLARVHWLSQEQGILQLSDSRWREVKLKK